MRRLMIAAFAALAFASAASAGHTPAHKHCKVGEKVCGDMCIRKDKVCHKPHRCDFNQICNSHLPHL
jgi:hypothetical protein